MEAMRESWTDERLDDFRAETGRRFDEVDKRFDKVDARFDKVDARFDRVEAKFDKIDARFERLDERLEALNRTMLQFGIGSMIVFVVGFASLIVSQV